MTSRGLDTPYAGGFTTFPPFMVRRKADPTTLFPVLMLLPKGTQEESSGKKLPKFQLRPQMDLHINDFSFSWGSCTQAINYDIVHALLCR